jgi:hypothetical protein
MTGSKILLTWDFFVLILPPSKSEVGQNTGYLGAFAVAVR